MTTARKRAPSARSLETKARILNAAEQVFSVHGFEGASLRDIAKLAEVPVGLVQHHGNNKEDLFCQTVSRRAEELSRIRVEGLEELKENGDLTLRNILDCFMRAYLTLAQHGGDHWLAYGRLVAHVSSDPRWKDLAAECFDPTVARFLDEILALYPEASRDAAAAGQIYSVSAMLAFLNSGWRIDAMSPGAGDADIEHLIDFCTAGMEAVLKRPS